MEQPSHLQGCAADAQSCGSPSLDGVDMGGGEGAGVARTLSLTDKTTLSMHVVGNKVLATFGMVSWDSSFAPWDGSVIAVGKIEVISTPVTFDSGGFGGIGRPR